MENSDVIEIYIPRPNVAVIQTEPERLKLLFSVPEIEELKEALTALLEEIRAEIDSEEPLQTAEGQGETRE